MNKKCKRSLPVSRSNKMAAAVVGHFEGETMVKIEAVITTTRMTVTVDE